MMACCGASHPSAEFFSPITVPTCSFLEGGNGFFQAPYGLSVTTSTDLRVQSSHVEEDAGLLQ